MLIRSQSYPRKQNHCTKWILFDENSSGIQRTTQRTRDKRIIQENSEQIVKTFYYNCNGMAQKRWQSRGEGGDGGSNSSSCC